VDASAARDEGRSAASCRESYPGPGRGYRSAAAHGFLLGVVAAQGLPGAPSECQLHPVLLRQGDFQWVANRAAAVVSCLTVVPCLDAQLRHQLDRELVPDEEGFAGWAELPQQSAGWAGQLERLDAAARMRAPH
jgi:hypothetical protein